MSMRLLVDSPSIGLTTGIFSTHLSPVVCPEPALPSVVVSPRNSPIAFPRGNDLDYFTFSLRLYRLRAELSAVSIPRHLLPVVMDT